jgi:hypothetical protein
MKSAGTRILLIAITLIISACDTLGPKALRQGRTDYSTSILDTNNEQFLLNIVRVRYNKTPYVLDISSISSRIEFEGRLSGTTTSNNSGLIGDSLGAGVTYKEKPTIIYQPLRGKDFVRQLMTPVDLQTLVLLRQSGWEMDDILRVFANEINGIPNASTGADSTPEGIPEFEEFLEISEILDEIEDAGDLILGSQEGKDSLLLRVKPRMQDTEDFREFARLLQLDPELPSYKVKLGIGSGGNDTILLETRPILSAMFFIGQGIDIPEEHRKNNIVNQNYDIDGNVYDWSPVHEGLISIKSSNIKPSDAAIAVKHEGYWFYIEADDVDSRETLTMLSIVFTLQAGGSRATEPVLTIPVN